MESVIIQVKSNIGNGTVKMKVFSHEHISDAQKSALSAMKRDEAIKFGNANGWKVVDIEEWE